MKKLIVFLFVFSLLTGCGERPTQPTQTQQTTPVENVTIQISDISPTGATVILTDTNTEPYVYGEWYKIQRKTEGGWQDVPPVIDNYGFHEIGYLPNDKGEVTFVINWEWLYGTLPAGTYRMFKQVNFQEITIEFTI